MAEEIKIQKEFNHYTATHNGRTLWIKHDYRCDTWDVVEPWVEKAPNGFYKSKRLETFPRLYKAKEGVVRILTKGLYR